MLEGLELARGGEFSTVPVCAGIQTSTPHGVGSGRAGDVGSVITPAALLNRPRPSASDLIANQDASDIVWRQPPALLYPPLPLLSPALAAGILW